MLAIFKFLLHKITGQDDIIVGSPIAGRNQAQIEPLIGFFVNVLPLRSDLSGNPTFKEFLDQVRQTALGAYANQDYPFDKLVEVVNPVRDLSRSPIFDVIFDFREASADPFANVHFGDMSLTDITGDDPNAKFDLFVTGNEGEDGITMKFEYNADLFEAATIAQMSGYYQNLIQEVLAAPEKRLSEMEMLAPEDRSQVLVGFNQTACPFPMDKCTHELFEEQAVLYPDKDALVFG
jgi:non-ribosomal peptide synthetase component F